MRKSELQPTDDDRRLSGGGDQVHWEGLVRKKGDWLPRWEERYLVLDGATLTYYNSKKDAQQGKDMKGRMILTKVRSENYGKAHGFLIETQGHKVFHLCCGTELEKDTWIEMMQAAIDGGVARRLSSTLLTDTDTEDSFSKVGSPNNVDLRQFYAAFRRLLISHSNSSDFFPKLSREVVLTSNYAPTVPFWGEYHGLDGVLHFFSIVYETVDVMDFKVTDIAQSAEGNTAVVAGRETMVNKSNGRRFTQQWQHTIQFSSSGKIKSIVIEADPVAASAVFGTKATSNLTLPVSSEMGNSAYENPSGVVSVKALKAEHIEPEHLDGPLLPFLVTRLDGHDEDDHCSDRTQTWSEGDTGNPCWNTELQVYFPGSKGGKQNVMILELWSASANEQEEDELVAVGRVNLAPYLALASTSKTVRESVVNRDVARGAVPQWYTLSSPETKISCGRVQLAISFEKGDAPPQKITREENPPPMEETESADTEEEGKENDSSYTASPSATVSDDAETPKVRPAQGTRRKPQPSTDRKPPPARPGTRQSKSHSVFQDTRRNNHQFKVGQTSFDIPVRYQMIKAVGQGAYGCVIAASDIETGQAVAIKNIPNGFNDLVDSKRILREIRLMRHLHHPNLVNLVDLLRPPSLADFEDVYIVTDLMETDLHRVIHSNQALSDEHVKYFLYQMLVALKYIHSANVLHRDLKPSNVLVNADCDLKICDFGLARGVEGVDSGLTEYVVTRWYRAPELLLSSDYDKPMDVWAVGCILAEILGRRPLFPGHDYLHQLKIIMDVVGTPSEEDMDFITNPKAKRFVLRQPKKEKVPFSELFPRASSECLDLLEKMLIFNPRKRIKVDEALEHPYFESVRDISVEATCPVPFNFDFENTELTKRKLQELMFEDICYFHPEAQLEELRLQALRSSEAEVDKDKSERSPQRSPTNPQPSPTRSTHDSKRRLSVESSKAAKTLSEAPPVGGH